MTEDAAPDDQPEQVQVRRDKRQRMLDDGIEPYPVGYPRTHTLAEVRADVARPRAGTRPPASTSASPVAWCSSATAASSASRRCDPGTAPSCR